MNYAAPLPKTLPMHFCILTAKEVPWANPLGRLENFFPAVTEIATVSTEILYVSGQTNKLYQIIFQSGREV